MPRDFSLQLKNPTALRYFYEVAQAGSFRRAAERTHIAVSAVNRQVKNLEDEVGAVLFERGRGRSGLKLTEAGEIFLAHLKRAMSEIATARAELEGLRGMQRGHVNFGVNSGFSREMLPQLLAAFHKKHPGITYGIKIESSIRLVELAAADEIDFALGFNPPMNAGIEVLARREIGSCVMVPRKHPLAKRSWVKLSDCAEYEFVMPDSSLGLHNTLERMFADVGIQPRVVLTTNSYELLRSAASSGVGVAILSQYLSGRDPNHPDAAFVTIRDPRIRPQMLVCFTRAGRHLSVAAHALVAEIRTVLQSRI